MTTQSIKDLLRTAESLIRENENQLQILKGQRDAILMLRYDCDHQFGNPYPGYEHEGGTCTLCGINEIHAACQKIGLKYKLMR